MSKHDKPTTDKIPDHTDHSSPSQFGTFAPFWSNIKSEYLHFQSADCTLAVSFDQRTKPPCDFLMMYV